MVDNSTKKIFDLEADAEGFELAHKKDRHFLDNFLNVVSWLFTKNDTYILIFLLIWFIRISCCSIFKFIFPLKKTPERVVFNLV